MLARLHGGAALDLTRAALVVGVLLCAWPVAAQPNQPAPATNQTITIPPITFAVPQHIVCDSGCGSPPATPDRAAFTAGTTNISPTGGVFNDGLSVLTSGMQASPRVTAYRAFHFNLRNAAGAELGITTSPLVTAVQSTAGTELAINEDGSINVTPTGGVTILDPTTQTPVDAKTSTPAGTEMGLIVRNIPSGTQAVSVASLPLPAGSGTEATLALIKAKTDNLDVTLSTRTKPADNQNVIVTNALTVAQGASGSTADPWSIQLRDQAGNEIESTTTDPAGGQRGLIVRVSAVKAASTAALAADRSLVVGLSPNSPLPTGSNTIGALTANQSVNVAQMGGVATSMNTGVRDTGTQRVTIATNDVVPVTGTFWQATQPVSGTVTTTPPSNASTNVAQLAGTATAVNSGVKDAGTLRVVLATDQPALTNKLLVTPDSVALPANQSVNVAQMGGIATSMNTGVRDTGTQRVTIATNDVVPVSGTVTTTPPANASTNVAQLAGTTTDTNSGVKSAGTLRVVLATDQPALTNKLLVTPDSVALPANQSVNVAQVGGTATVTGGVAGILAVGGNVANAVAATANPVPVGGIFTTTPATLTTGQTGTLQFTAAQNVKQDLTTVGGTAVATGTGAGGAGIPRVTVSNDSNVIVTPPTLTKATQGATGFSTQDLKDAGRSSIMLTGSIASTAVAETLITLTKSAGLAATTTCSSCGITTGKRFRIQAVVLSARNSTGVVTSNITVNLRAAVAGATTAASPLQLHYVVNLPASAATTVFPVTLIPDGFEIDANGATNTYGVTITHPQWVTGTTVATFDLSIIGYEY